MVTIASHFSRKRLVSDDYVCGRAFAPILINTHHANRVVLGSMSVVDGRNSLLGSEQNTGVWGRRKWQLRGGRTGGSGGCSEPHPMAIQDTSATNLFGISGTLDTGEGALSRKPCYSG